MPRSIWPTADCRRSTTSPGVFSSRSRRTVVDEIELDAGEQLAEFVVQLARDARPLFFAHLLETLRQRGIEIGGRSEWQLQAACTFNTAGPFRACCQTFTDTRTV